MKTLKLIMILAIAGLSSGITSCSKNDDPIHYDTSALIGKWMLTWSEGYQKDSEESFGNIDWNESKTNERIIVVFESNGWGYFVEMGANDPFKWNLDKDRLTISEDGEEETARILSLDAKQMILEFHEQTTTFEQYSKDTYKKIE